MPQICDMGQTALLPFWRKACWGFFCPKNPTALARSEPAILGNRGQHANHQTTKAVCPALWVIHIWHWSKDTTGFSFLPLPIMIAGMQVIWLTNNQCRYPTYLPSSDLPDLTKHVRKSILALPQKQCNCNSSLTAVYWTLYTQMLIMKIIMIFGLTTPVFSFKNKNLTLNNTQYTKC
jgi:hypothetical protein